MDPQILAAIEEVIGDLEILTKQFEESKMPHLAGQIHAITHILVKIKEDK